MAVEIVAGGIGGMAGICLSQPLDVVRIRLACQDGTSKTYTGITSCLRKTLVGEGIRGIYKGVASPMASMGILNAVLFYTYEGLLRNLEGSSRANKSTRPPTIWNIWVAASLSGFVSALINTPTELVKSVAQVDTKSKGTAREELYIAVKTLKNGGFSSKGLFRGYILITIRDVGSYGVYFAFYEWVCRKYERSKFVSFVSGGVAGVLSWLSVYPVEYIVLCWKVLVRVLYVHFLKRVPFLQSMNM